MRRLLGKVFSLQLLEYAHRIHGKTAIRAYRLHNGSAGRLHTIRVNVRGLFRQALTRVAWTNRSNAATAVARSEILCGSGAESFAIRHR